MSKPALQMVGVSRTFRSRGNAKTAVRELSLTVNRGEILCLLGPNGAGKTTTVKMAATLLAPSSGSIQINGTDAVNNPRAARRSLGLALGGERGFYMRSGARTNLEFFARLQGVSSNQLASRVTNALQAVQLETHANTAVEHFSKGMKQRLHIARAIVSQPSLLILDEPSSGLDVESTRELHQIVGRLRENGAGILLTTHSMHEAETLANRLTLMSEGTVLVDGSIHDFSRHASFELISTIRMGCLTAQGRELIAQLANIATVVTREQDGVHEIDVVWRRATDHTANSGQLSELAPETRIWTRPPTLNELYVALLAPEMEAQ